MARGFRSGVGVGQSAPYGFTDDRHDAGGCSAGAAVFDSWGCLPGTAGDGGGGFGGGGGAGGGVLGAGGAGAGDDGRGAGGRAVSAGVSAGVGAGGGGAERGRDDHGERGVAAVVRAAGVERADRAGGGLGIV